jgi:hypothetical protein
MENSIHSSINVNDFLTQIHVNYAGCLRHFKCQICCKQGVAQSLPIKVRFNLKVHGSLCHTTEESRLQISQQQNIS